MEMLSRGELEALARFSTPTIANAIETFRIQPRTEGYMSPELRSQFPDMGPMVGYAFTVQILSSRPYEGANRRGKYWEMLEALQATPKPAVSVVEDLDPAPPRGAFWGEIQATLHKRLGALGVITNGGVRDLDEVRAIGFQFFSPAVTVSHAYVHVVDFGRPVRVGGLTVDCGDLVHADKHGVVVVPPVLAKELAARAAEFEARERTYLDLMASPDFSLTRLRELMDA